MVDGKRKFSSSFFHLAVFFLPWIEIGSPQVSEHWRIEKEMENIEDLKLSSSDFPLFL